jgi:hypothetical protein
LYRRERVNWWIAFIASWRYKHTEGARSRCPEVRPSCRAAHGALGFAIFMFWAPIKGMWSFFSLGEAQVERKYVERESEAEVMLSSVAIAEKQS